MDCAARKGQSFEGGYRVPMIASCALGFGGSIRQRFWPFGGQTRHFERTPFTSGLPQLADILSARRHVSNVPLPGSCPKQRKAYSITSSARAHHAHSGNPAFRRPSVNSFMFDCAPRAIHADICKGGIKLKHTRRRLLGFSVTSETGEDNRLADRSTVA